MRPKQLKIKKVFRKKTNLIIDAIPRVYGGIHRLVEVPNQPYSTRPGLHPPASPGATSPAPGAWCCRASYGAAWPPAHSGWPWYIAMDRLQKVSSNRCKKVAIYKRIAQFGHFAEKFMTCPQEWLTLTYENMLQIPNPNRIVQFLNNFVKK